MTDARSDIHDAMVLMREVIAEMIYRRGRELLPDGQRDHINKRLGTRDVPPQLVYEFFQRGFANLDKQEMSRQAAIIVNEAERRAAGDPLQGDWQREPLTSTEKAKDLVFRLALGMVMADSEHVAKDMQRQIVEVFASLADSTDQQRGAMRLAGFKIQEEVPENVRFVQANLVYGVVADKFYVGFWNGSDPEVSDLTLFGPFDSDEQALIVRNNLGATLQKVAPVSENIEPLAKLMVTLGMVDDAKIKEAFLSAFRKKHAH